MLFSPETLSSGVFTEPWFGTLYKVDTISEDLLKEWSTPPTVDSSLHLPPRNDFIARDFSLRPPNNRNGNFLAEKTENESEDLGETGAKKEGGETENLGGKLGDSEKGGVESLGKAVHPLLPVVLSESSRSRMWYKKDDVFFTPRAEFYISAWSQLAAESAKNSVLLELSGKLLEDSLNKILYLVAILPFFRFFDFLRPNNYLKSTNFSIIAKVD